MRKNDYLETPEYIYKSLGHIDLDPCAGVNTSIGKVNWYIDRGENGLERDWFGFVYCNPPFSEKKFWIQKMIEHNNGLMILPERGSAPWFGRLAHLCEYYFVAGKKINFIGSTSSSNVGSVIFPFGLEATSRLLNIDLPGHVVRVSKYLSREESPVKY